MDLSERDNQEFEEELNRLRSSNDALKKRISFLEQMSEFDEVTHLYSQGYFDRRFTQELRRAERYCEFLSLVLVDVNSVLAEQSPRKKTKSLKSLGGLIGDTVRATDIVTSLGKNRLALILTETPKEGAFRLAERLSEKIAGTALPTELEFLRDEPVNIGIASFPEDGGCRDDLLQVASSPLNDGSSVLRSTE